MRYMCVASRNPPVCATCCHCDDEPNLGIDDALDHAKVGEVVPQREPRVAHAERAERLAGRRCARAVELERRVGRRAQQLAHGRAAVAEQVRAAAAGRRVGARRGRSLRERVAENVVDKPRELPLGAARVARAVLEAAQQHGLVEVAVAERHERQRDALEDEHGLARRRGGRAETRVAVLEVAHVARRRLRRARRRQERRQLGAPGLLAHLGAVAQLVDADEDLRVAQPAPRRRARRARREEGERHLEDVAAREAAALDHLAGRAEHDARELAEWVLERFARRPHKERLAAAAGAASGAASAAQLPLEDVASLQPRQPDISRTPP